MLLFYKKIRNAPGKNLISMFATCILHREKHGAFFIRNTIKRKTGMLKMKFLSLLAMSVLAVSLSAETVKYDLQKEFSKVKAATVEGEVLTFKGPGSLAFPAIKFDPAAKYTLNVDLKQVPGAKTFPVHYGFYCYDSKGRQILHHHVAITQKTATVLAADAKVGDKTITVKDASNWKKDYWIAFNAKADLSDLPNRELVRAGKSIEKKGDVWIVTLTTPLKKAYAAGTAVREHSSGGYIYVQSGVKVGADWKTISGEVSGLNPLTNGGYNKKFWPGTVTIRPMLLLNWNWSVKDSAVQVRNVNLTITK